MSVDEDLMRSIQEYLKSWKICEAHGTLSDIWHGPSLYSNCISPHTQIHKYLKIWNNSFPTHLLQNILCWSLFSSFFYLQLHAQSINRPFITVINIIGCIILVIKASFTKELQITPKVLQLVFLHIIILMCPRFIITSLFVTYIMLLDDPNYDKIHIISTFIENGETEQEKIDRFISIHYYILTQYFEHFQHADDFIIHPELLEFKEIITSCYSLNDKFINLSLKKYRRLEFLSSQFLNIDGLKIIKRAVIAAISESEYAKKCCGWGSIRLELLSTYFDQNQHIGINSDNWFITIVWVLCFLNIFDSYLFGGADIDTFAIALITFDLVLLFYIISYAISENKWIYNFEELYGKCAIHTLLGRNSLVGERILENMPNHINVVYYHRKQRRFIYQILMEDRILYGQKWLAMIIIEYTMNKEPYTYKDGKNEKCICFMNPTTCQYEMSRDCSIRHPKSQTYRRWRTLIIDLILASFILYTKFSFISIIVIVMFVIVSFRFMGQYC